MSTSLKRIVGMLVTTMALSVVALLVLPGMAAEAQEGAPADLAGGVQSTSQDTEATTIPQPAAFEEPAVRLVVQGDSLWSIAQERLGPNATPRQTMDEVERIYELNRNLIGEDPNLLLPGQKLLVAQGTEPVADASVTEFTSTTAQEEPATAKQPEPKYEPASEQTNGWAYSRLTLLLSFGLFLFALAVAVLGVWKLRRTRRLLKEYYYGTYDRLRYPEEREANAPTADATLAPDPAAEGLQPLVEQQRFPLLETPGFERSLGNLGLVWVNCPHQETTRLLGEALGTKACLYNNEEPPADEIPSLVVLCPKGEDVGSEMGRLRSLAWGAPVLVLGLDFDPQLARTALLAGADGFIHLGMQPTQMVRSLSAALEGETLISRDLLEAFLAEMVSQAGLTILTPRQREFLELVIWAATFEDEIVTPKELLAEFLLGEEAWPQELFRIQ